MGNFVKRNNVQTEMEVLEFMTMSKIDTMIYADEHGICSVFTFNPKIESQLNELALKIQSDANHSIATLLLEKCIE